jgi:hypothetical protein
MPTIYEDLASLRAENARLRGEVERLGDARDEAYKVRNESILWAAVHAGQYVALRERAEAAEQLAEDRLRMLDIAVRNASEAAGQERTEILDALWDKYYATRGVAGDSRAVGIGAAIDIVKSRNPAPAGEEVRDGDD